jgi:hypothetical protein
MTKPDDSSLDPDELRAVEERARALLDAGGRYPRRGKADGGAA